MAVEITIIIFKVRVVVCSSSAEAYQSCELSQSQAELQTHKNTISVVSTIFTAATQLLRQAQACSGLFSITISNRVILQRSVAADLR